MDELNLRLHKYKVFAFAKDKHNKSLLKSLG